MRKVVDLLILLSIKGELHEVRHKGAVNGFHIAGRMNTHPSKNGQTVNERLERIDPFLVSYLVVFGGRREASKE